KDEVRVGDMPVFRFSRLWELHTVERLPAPTQPFGIDLRGIDLPSDVKLDVEVLDARLKELAGLKELRYLELNISMCKGKDAGLKALAGIKQLWHLRLRGGESVTDAGLSHLSALKELQTLDVHACRFAEMGLKEIAKLKELRTLNLMWTRV